MEPNAPPAPPPMQPTPTPQPSNPYDFIVNPGKPKKKSLLPSSGSSKVQRALVITVVLIIIVVLFMVGSSLLSSGDKAKKEQLISVAKQQNELIRVSEIGLKKAKSAEARNLAMTTQLSLISEQAELQSAVKGTGVKISAKTIGGKDPKTDDLFTKAEQANNFDDVFIQKLQADLTKYAKAVKVAYNNTTSKKAKLALEAQFNNAATLANFKE